MKLTVTATLHPLLRHVQILPPNMLVWKSMAETLWSWVLRCHKCPSNTLIGPNQCGHDMWQVSWTNIFHGELEKRPVCRFLQTHIKWIFCIILQKNNLGFATFVYSYLRAQGDGLPSLWKKSTCVVLRISLCVRQTLVQGFLIFIMIEIWTKRLLTLHPMFRYHQLTCFKSQSGRPWALVVPPIYIRNFIKGLCDIALPL